MPSTRTFLSIPTPDAIRSALVDVQAELRSVQADVKWEQEDKLHITLRFLGDVDERELPLLMKECTDNLCNLFSFSLIYGGLGCFPDLRNPRIVWAGSENKDGSLLRMKDIVDDIVTRYGFEREKRAFHPHITLGRVKGNRNMTNLIKKLQNVTFEPQSALITELHFMKSELRSSGSIYTILNTIPLRSENG